MMNAPATVVPPPPSPSNLDRDHALLAKMLERIATNGCTVAQTDRNCALCPAAAAEACRAALTDMAMEFMVFLIDHQRHEDEMMARLPRTDANQAHCILHRDIHVEFTSRYNKLIWRFGHLPLSDSIHMLEALISDWIRHHALDFDSRLIRLLEGTRGR